MSTRRHLLKQRIAGPTAAAAAFWIYLLVAGAVLFASIGDRWFAQDEWEFLSNRSLSSLDSLLRPYNEHWVTVPLVVFRILYRVFGLDHYGPYAAVSIASHLAVVAATRAVLRRFGVSPWLATAGAAALALFGPGLNNVLVAFQITFTFAVLFSLLQLVLADHPERSLGRELAAVACGLAAISSSGIGLPLAALTCAVLFVRRGWKQALTQAVPLAVAYAAWMSAYWLDARGAIPAPTLERIQMWSYHSALGVFMGLGHYRPVAVALAVLLVVGLVGGGPSPQVEPSTEAHTQDHPPRPGWIGRHQMLLIALGFLSTLAVIVLLTARTRWFLGPVGARSDRYIYTYAVLLTVALYLSIQNLASRWRATGFVVAAMLMLALPANARISQFPSPLANNLFTGTQTTYRSLIAMPEARLVSPDFQPVAGVYAGPAPTIGFLLSAHDAGKLRAVDQVPEDVRNHNLVLLGLAQRRAELAPAACDNVVGDEPRSYPVGTRFQLSGTLTVTLTDSSGNPLGAPVGFSIANGDELTVELDDLTFDLVVTSGTLALC